MVQFLTSHLSVLFNIVIGALLVVSEILGLNPNNSKPKGIVDGIIKSLKDVEPSDPTAPKV